MDATPSSDESPVVLHMAPIRPRATWLTALGVCSIIFGAMGLFTGCFHVQLPVMVAMSPVVKWATAAATTFPATAAAVATGVTEATGSTGVTWSQSSGFGYSYNVTVGSTTRPASGPAFGIPGGAPFGPGGPALTGPMPQWDMTVPVVLLGVAALVHWGLALYLLILGIGALAQWRSIGSNDSPLPSVSRGRNSAGTE